MTSSPRAVADRTNLPSILSTIAARRHSIFGHIRRQSDSTPAHKALKLVVNARSGELRHSTSRLESSSWPTTDLMDGLSSVVCNSLLLTHGLLPTTGQLYTTHSQLREAVSEISSTLVYETHFGHRQLIRPNRNDLTEEVVGDQEIQQTTYDTIR